MHSTIPNVNDATRQVPSLWESWGENWAPGYQTWQRAISEAADLIADHADLWGGLLAEQDGKTPLDLAREALELGAILGYSLSRTWPGNIEDLAEWPHRAMEHAGLASVDQVEPWLGAAS